MRFRDFFKSKAVSSAENVGRLQTSAKKLGIDKASLTTSMGGMNTDHYELHKRVREEETFLFSKRASKWAYISALVSIGSLIIALIALFK